MEEEILELCSWCLARHVFLSSCGRKFPHGCLRWLQENLAADWRLGVKRWVSHALGEEAWVVSLLLKFGIGNVSLTEELSRQKANSLL